MPVDRRQMEVVTMEAPSSAAGRRRNRRPSSGLRDLHDDMLERVLTRLTPTFLGACDPWFLLLSASDSSGCRPSVASA